MVHGDADGRAYDGAGRRVYTDADLTRGRRPAVLARGR